MATFSDDFNRADGAVGANWVQVSGTWTVASNQLSPGTSGSTVVLRAATGMDTSDHSAQITIAATTPVSQGVWCRGDSTLANGYVMRNDGTSWALFKVVSGTFTSIGTYAAAAAAGDIAKIQAVGSLITGTINGVVRISLTDTAVTTGTSVGLRSMSTSGLRYDNFVAADVATSAALGTASSIETAQPLTGSKTAPLGTAAEVGTAQPLTGAKTAGLAYAAATEAAQPLTGLITAALGTASAAETAQPLASSLSVVLGPAVESAAAQPLTGAKTAPLGPAMETSTARPLTTGGTALDIDVTVGEPYSPWSVGAPQGASWLIGPPH